MAQLGSAPRLGRGGRTFESCHPDHLKKTHFGGSFFVWNIGGSQKRGFAHGDVTSPHFVWASHLPKSASYSVAFNGISCFDFVILSLVKSTAASAPSRVLDFAPRSQSFVFGTLYLSTQSVRYPEFTLFIPFAKSASYSVAFNGISCFDFVILSLVKSTTASAPSRYAAVNEEYEFCNLEMIDSIFLNLFVNIIL